VIVLQDIVIYRKLAIPGKYMVMMRQSNFLIEEIMKDYIRG